jgi:hypothetical protein
VLSENGGAFFAPRVLNLGVAVWRAFEELVEAWACTRHRRGAEAVRARGVALI